MKQKIIIILGPTGIGKTPVTLKLAERINAEIVTADSVQVYRYLDIGSAKPTHEERARIPHYLIDVVDPDEEFSAGRYREYAQQAIASIAGKNKPVLVSGGTGLYIKALTRGLFSENQGNEIVRQELRDYEARMGKGSLHKELERVDPDAAKRIHPNDLFRTIRALEVYRETGVPLSQHHGRHHFQEAPYDYIQIGIHLERDELYQRINERCDRMMAEGFLEEVQSLIDRGYHCHLKSMQSLGYRQLCAFLEGAISLDEAVQIMKRDTRRYAKRQMTWFRSDPSTIWVEQALDKAGGIEMMVRDFLAAPG